eukprot:7801423-Pyramimonas_sp.AAC.1
MQHVRSSTEWPLHALRAVTWLASITGLVAHAGKTTFLRPDGGDAYSAHRKFESVALHAWGYKMSNKGKHLGFWIGAGGCTDSWLG